MGWLAHGWGVTPGVVRGGMASARRAGGVAGDLMLYAGSVRTISVFFEPIARSKSQRSIVRDAAKIETDAAHRAEKGFRVGAHHRRAAHAVQEAAYIPPAGS